MNIPNTITAIRIVLVLPLIYFFISTIYKFSVVGFFFIFLVAALTDWLDGYLARKLNQITALGKFLDPLTDKILIIAPLLILIERQQLRAWAVFIIIIREIVIAGWRVNPQLSSDNDISGANIWGKLKTVTQIGAIALLIIPVPQLTNIGLILFWIALVLTVISGSIYLGFPSFSLGKIKE